MLHTHPGTDRTFAISVVDEQIERVEEQTNKQTNKQKSPELLQGRASMSLLKLCADEP
jgi:hypothetical protein